MFKKIYYFYKSRGLINTLKQIIKSVNSRIGIAIIFQDRKIVSGLAKSRKIFSKRKLKNNDDGYWYVDPMPTSRELSNYYSLNYWGSVQEKNYGVSLRDLRHFYILNKTDPKFNTTKRKILNFGAGHGGISIILRLLGHEIVNIEPSNLIDLFETDWKVHKNLDDIEDINFDLIYASHSLEHVRDINKLNKKFKTTSKKETIFFFEVPNGNHSECGPMEKRIEIPHTYYFRLEYFEKKFSEILVSYCYSSKKAKNLSPKEFSLAIEKDGDCLLVVAKKII